MPWIEGTHEETFTVDAPLEDVASYFAEPSRFKEAMNELESAEEVEDGVWKWTLQEMEQKGVEYQAVYTVQYERDGNTVSWHTLEGNMRSEGQAELTDLGGDQTEVHYTETIAADLPIPKLAAKLFKPIVSREIAKGVGKFLESSREILD